MGCATAYYLTRECGVDVTLVECSGEVASQASGKAGGFLGSDWSSGSLGKLAMKSFELHEELAKEFGADNIGYR